MADSNRTYLDFTKKPDFKDILTNPILDIAARFWDEKRYTAFKICYRSMRVIDDLVDNKKAEGKIITDNEKNILKQMMADWLVSFQRKQPNDSYMEQLLKTIDEFQIPIWPWERLVKSMKYDLDHDGFESLLIFLRYSEGAAIAPASIFMHLCGAKEKDGKYLPPEYNIRCAARYLALFSYLVHIIRDFQKDQLENLNYFSRKLMIKNNLTDQNLRRIASDNNPTDDFRNLIKQYYNIADYYRKKACLKIEELQPYLKDQYRLSLDIIYQLYLQIFEKIDYQRGNFDTKSLNPTKPEIQKRIDDIISKFYN